MDLDKEQMTALVKKAQEVLDKQPDFSESDLATLHQMLNAWKGWVALGRAARWVIVTLGMAAAAVASWSTLTKAVKAWMQS